MTKFKTSLLIGGLQTANRIVRLLLSQCVTYWLTTISKYVAQSRVTISHTHDTPMSSHVNTNPRPLHCHCHTRCAHNTNCPNPKKLNMSCATENCYPNECGIDFYAQHARTNDGVKCIAIESYMCLGRQGCALLFSDRYPLEYTKGAFGSRPEMFVCATHPSIHICP